MLFEGIAATTGGTIPAQNYKVAGTVPPAPTGNRQCLVMAYLEGQPGSAVSGDIRFGVASRSTLGQNPQWSINGFRAGLSLPAPGGGQALLAYYGSTAASVTVFSGHTYELGCVISYANGGWVGKDAWCRLYWICQ